jgi:hypothetical protein
MLYKDAPKEDECANCAMTMVLQPCEACRCSIHGILLQPIPDSANKGRTSILTCPICLKKYRSNKPI